jgi:predicted lipoprotein with Yx(FWY)xxD motif
MRRSRVLGASTFLVLSGLLATVLPAAAADVQAVVGKVIGSHGTLMVAASNSMTLYTFTKDVRGDGKSNCTGGCLTAWPALTIPAGSTPTGDATVTGPLGTIVRADNGATQVTYDGWPLYFFAKDLAPGDTNGIYTNWEAIVLVAAAPAPTAAAPEPTLPATSTSASATTSPATVGLAWMFAAVVASLGAFVAVARRSRRSR